MNTPNGQKVQIMLEELKDVYGTEWDYTLMSDPLNNQTRKAFSLSAEESKPFSRLTLQNVLVTL